MESGGIYVRWRDRLWQEQPDGSYLLWDEATHEWLTSTLQPPSEGGQTVSTIECPNCGKRVKSTLRSCPYCEYGFEAPPVRQAAPAGAAPAPVARKRRARPLSASTLLVAIGLAAAVAFGVFLKLRSDSCENWKAGIRSYTRLAIEAEGLPRGLTEAEFRNLNEDRFADKRPGGCE